MVGPSRWVGKVRASTARNAESSFRKAIPANSFFPASRKEKVVKPLGLPPLARAVVYSGTDGRPPSTAFDLVVLAAPSTLRAAGTGPDHGISNVITLADGGLRHIDFDTQTHWAYGNSTSLYDMISEDVRAGDPIADCFASLSYEHHTVMAVGDGVGWGKPSKRAARCAVLGAADHLHRHLQGGELLRHAHGMWHVGRPPS